MQIELTSKLPLRKRLRPTLMPKFGAAIITVENTECSIFRQGLNKVLHFLKEREADESIWPLHLLEQQHLR